MVLFFHNIHVDCTEDATEDGTRTDSSHELSYISKQPADCTFQQLLFNLLLNHGKLLWRKLGTVKTLQHDAWPLWSLYHLSSDTLNNSTRWLACQQLLLQRSLLCTSWLFFWWHRSRCWWWWWCDLLLLEWCFYSGRCCGSSSLNSGARCLYLCGRLLY